MSSGEGILRLDSPQVASWAPWALKSLGAELRELPGERQRVFRVATAIPGTELPGLGA